MADNCTTCDVAIVGSGFAGSLIANELSKKGIKVIILEAGHGTQPNINEYMTRFYSASAKVPESPYPPALADAPATVAAGRPTALMLSKSNWNDPDQAYLDQATSKRPFKSTYERIAGGTSHWMGLTPRLVPNDFKMNHYRTDFPNWPIDYETVRPWYEKAEEELGISADVEEQRFAGMTFSDGYSYPMPRIPPSLFDQRVGAALARLTEDETKFLGTATPLTELRVRSLPAARNSQPYRNRRACAGNTSCIPICPIQAKYDATITLNEATNRGAQLIDQAVASEILVENNLISGINYVTYKGETGPETGTRCVKAKIYVIAANGIETPRLLLMSKNEGRTPNGVANSSDMVGRNLMDHPQYLTWGATAGIGTGIPLSRPPRDLGHRRPLRRSVPRPACRLPDQFGQRSLECGRQRCWWRPSRDDSRFYQWDKLQRPQQEGLHPTGGGQQCAVWCRPRPDPGQSDLPPVPDCIRR